MTAPAPAPRRRRLRAAFVAVVVMLLLVPALPAVAAASDDNVGNIGDVRNPQGLSLPVELALYVGIPIIGFIIAAFFALRPQRGASTRYRPGRPWTHEPVWFGDESSLDYEPKRAALPGAGGAHGSW